MDDNLPKKSPIYPPCWQKRTNCFAYVAGECMILLDTHFGARACPFFKTRAEIARQRAMMRKRRETTQIRTQ